MEDYDVQHLPVVNERKMIGVVSKDDLLDIEQNLPVSVLENDFLPVMLKGEEHFLNALRKMSEHQLSLLPVVSEQGEYLGVILPGDLMLHVSTFVGNQEGGGVIVLETDKRHFSFGEISRLIETNDAYITHLNTYTETVTGLVIVTIKVNKDEISDIIATFQRYEYTVRYYFGREQYANELQENYQHLISYLSI